MRYSENIEKLFVDDIREKKRTGRGAFSMRGKGVKHGFSGALKTPYHYMTAKEKRKLNGEVKTMNMYTTVLNWSEFQAKDRETQKQLLIKWREVHSNKEIMKALSEGHPTRLNNQSYNDIVTDLGCPKKRSGNPNPELRKSKPKKVKVEETSPQLSFEVEPQVPEIHKEPERAVVKQAIISEGLHLEYNGKYDVEALNKFFTKLQLLIDGDTNDYHISLSLTEIIKE